MNYPNFFNSKKSLNLFGLQENLKFLTNLYLYKKLPKVLMFSGNKGSGKSTLINHFLFSIFDTENYNNEKCILTNSSYFLKQFQDNVFPNIIYVKGDDFKSIKIDDIRDLKTKIYQSTFLNKDRFIILDDVELFNPNTLNALLKIIEEPAKNNYFFLINNKSRPLLDTIKSRALEIKIILKEEQRLEIIENLKNLFKIDLNLDPSSTQLTPGNFIKFNFIFEEHNISLNRNFVENLTLLLNLYKKNKNILFINLAFFIADYYFRQLKANKTFNNNKIYEIRNYVFTNLNNFMLYNINQNTLINVVNTKLNYE
jgi:DNA polymerase-3 subunit delta'